MMAISFPPQVNPGLLELQAKVSETHRLGEGGVLHTSRHPGSHSPTCTALTRDLGIYCPWLFPLLQLEDQIRFGAMIPCQWEITKDVGFSQIARDGEATK